MSFRLVDTGWDQVLADAVAADRSGVRLVCPFIKKRAVERLLAGGTPGSFQVITRFCLDDFAQGVSDLSALRLLLDSGAAIRGIKNLHAKLYLFGSRRAIVTSANLTEAALVRNHEFGFVAENSEIVTGCEKYFTDLWAKAGVDLSSARLAQWEQKVTTYLATGARPMQHSGLGDEGVNAGIAPEIIELPPVVDESRQAFVKFFGVSSERAQRSLTTLDEVRGSGSHWACTYPKRKRPRQVADGAILFLARLVEDPADIMIYGRAIGMRHVKERDDASVADIEVRPWKIKWPHYVRVHHAEFVAGTLANGIPLSALMDELNSNAFLPTQRNAAKGVGNTDPRRAYLQQAAVELTPQALAWVNEQLQLAFNRFGTLPAADLATLDWPTVFDGKADVE
ncbi:MAG: phospholipase D family protein [Planctomycetaceae bacterium]|nr:phospholipase D family protein [Planctomycetaceae bacterium]